MYYTRSASSASNAASKAVYVVFSANSYRDTALRDLETWKKSVGATIADQVLSDLYGVSLSSVETTTI